MAMNIDSTADNEGAFRVDYAELGNVPIDRTLKTRNMSRLISSAALIAIIIVIGLLFYNVMELGIADRSRFWHSRHRQSSFATMVMCEQVDQICVGRDAT